MGLSVDCYIFSNIEKWITTLWRDLIQEISIVRNLISKDCFSWVCFFCIHVFIVSLVSTFFLWRTITLSSLIYLWYISSPIFLISTNWLSCDGEMLSLFTHLFTFWKRSSNKFGSQKNSISLLWTRHCTHSRTKHNSDKNPPWVGIRAWLENLTQTDSTSKFYLFDWNVDFSSLSQHFCLIIQSRNTWAYLDGHHTLRLKKWRWTYRANPSISTSINDLRGS